MSTQAEADKALTKAYDEARKADAKARKALKNYREARDADAKVLAKIDKAFDVYEKALKNYREADAKAKAKAHEAYAKAEKAHKAHKAYLEATKENT